MKSSSCITKDFSSNWYKHWQKELHYAQNLHNKKWQQAAISQTLHEKHCLQPGMRGLGFGVGKERLPSLFAKYGVDIVATDQAATQKSKSWSATNQHSADRDALFYPDMVDSATFDKHVTFQPHDMNKLDKSLFGSFDFTWSSCAIGHLGSLDHALDFLCNQFKYLKPGGWAVHTTELNIASLDKTISENSGTVIFRLKDIDRLYNRMHKLGMRGEPFRLNLGNEPEDYSLFAGNGTKKDPQEPHLKRHFGPYIITQIILVFQKKSPSMFDKIKQRAHMWEAPSSLLDFKTNSPLGSETGTYFAESNVGQQL